MSGADKFMPMYWGDYARDTGDLNNSGHGAYLMLIKHYWGSARPLPDDDAKLWRIACCDSIGAWKKLRPSIEVFFKTGDGLWRHARVDRELATAAARYEKRSRAGQKGNDARWGKDGNATEEPPPEPPSEDRNATDAASQCDPNAIPMRSQPQPHLLTEKKEATLLGPELPAASPDAQAEMRRASALTAAFDAAIAAVWGAAQRRPWPHQNDPGIALKWLRSGVTPEMVTAVAEPRMRAMKAKDARRPDTLSYLDRLITETLQQAAQSGAPLPGTPRDPEREAAAKRYADAVNRWNDDGREGPAPTREEFGLPKVAA